MSQAESMRGPGSKPSLLFQLLIPSTAIFIITILSLIAVLFSDQRAPVAVFLNKHGNSLLAAEFVAVMLLCILAMAVDRVQTLRRLKQGQEEHPDIANRTSQAESDLCEFSEEKSV